MTVIIPLAGLGTRLRPFTYTRAKPLLHVAGKTVIGWIIDSLSNLSVDKLVLITGYMEEQIKEWVSENQIEEEVIWVTQKERKGLGHAIWAAGKSIYPRESVLIYLGDTIFDLDWKKIKDTKNNFVGVKEVKNPRRFGVVELREDKIIRLVEKPENPPTNLAVVGLYYIKEWGNLYKNLNYIIKNDIKTREEYQLTDALALMLENNFELKPLTIKEWYDCGTVESILDTNKKLLKKYSIQNLDENWISYPAYISSETIIENSNIGPNVSIAKGAVIKNSTIKNSIIHEDVMIKSSTVNNSIIGKNVTIEKLHGEFYLGDNSIISKKEV